MVVELHRPFRILQPRVERTIMRVADCRQLYHAGLQTYVCDPTQEFF
jgi:hypothetical protein